MKISAVPLTRSEHMARVRPRGNKSTEQKLASLFRQAGIKGWRRHLSLPGTPDFAFPKARLAIFGDGCFWHGCPKHGTQSKTNPEFRAAKITRNRQRDREVNRALRKKGWRVLRIWEHALKQNSVALMPRIIVLINLGIRKERRDSVEVMITRKTPRWSPKELKLLGRQPDLKVAEITGRSLNCVKRKRQRLGISIIADRYFSEREKELLGTMSDEDLARQLGRSVITIRKWRRS